MKIRQERVFGSSLGEGRAMRRRALDMMPPRAVTPTLSPATYFRYEATEILTGGIEC